MSKYYKASSFLIISLINEPIFSLTVPAKLQTYISAKKPILAIINGETSDIVVENNLGISVDPEFKATGCGEAQAFELLRSSA